MLVFNSGSFLLAMLISHIFRCLLTFGNSANHFFLAITSMPICRRQYSSNTHSPLWFTYFGKSSHAHHPLHFTHLSVGCHCESCWRSDSHVSCPTFQPDLPLQKQIQQVWRQWTWSWWVWWWWWQGFPDDWLWKQLPSARWHWPWPGHQPWNGFQPGLVCPACHGWHFWHQPLVHLWINDRRTKL